MVMIQKSGAIVKAFNGERSWLRSGRRTRTVGGFGIRAVGGSDLAAHPGRGHGPAGVAVPSDPRWGRQIHDANIVATKLAYGERRLLTVNVADFRRYADRIEIK